MPTIRHLVQTARVTREWVEADLFPLCESLRGQAEREPVMRGKALYCLFYEPSFLTRTSFERAAGLLGGEAHHTEDASQFFPVHNPRNIDDITSILASLKIDVVVIRTGDANVIERAAAVDAVPVINGGSPNDHPTQALADLYTLHREIGGIDGKTVVIVGRPEHRNVSALLTGLALFDGVNAVVVPFSGGIPVEIVEHCAENGLELTTVDDISAVSEADAIYLNGPRTAAHMQLLVSRGHERLVIDEPFMDSLKPHCIIMDPMQRTGDFTIAVEDERLAFYRQAENSLYARMAVLHQVFAE